MDAGRNIVVLRWIVAVLSTLGIGVPVAGSTILRGSGAAFCVLVIVLSAGPVYLYAWLVRTTVMSIVLAVAFVGLAVLLPIPGYREAFVTGAGAGGWLLWVDVFVGLPMIWTAFLGGWGIDALIRSTNRRSAISPRGKQ